MAAEGVSGEAEGAPAPEEEVSEMEVRRARVSASLSRAKASLIHADSKRYIHGSSTEQLSAISEELREGSEAGLRRQWLGGRFNERVDRATCPSKPVG